MKRYFKVTFQHSEYVYCTNLAHAETAEDVERHYSAYAWVNVKEAQPWDVDECKMKGMPIIEVEHVTETETETQTEETAETETEEVETETVNNINRTALMLTQYERYGTVGRDEYIENYINEELTVDISMLSEYNEYLTNKGYEPYFTFDDLEDDLQYMEPSEAFRLGKFSNFTYADDYLQYNEYGNIDGFSEYSVIEEMKNDKDFLRWYVENYVDLDEEEIEKTVNEANKLIAQGY